MRFVPVLILPLLLAGCASFHPFESEQQRLSRIEKEKRAALLAETAPVHAAFRAEKGWRSRVYRNDKVLAILTPDNAGIQISLKDQRGLLMVGELIAIDFPVATGRKSFPTPTGSFTIRDKKVVYKSNLYGKVVDAGGLVTAGDADSRTAQIPEGGSFVGASMPYWMRLTDTGVGLHVGYVPGHPASHGCIRVQRKVAPQIYERVKIGTPVIVTEQAPVSWP